MYQNIYIQKSGKGMTMTAHVWDDKTGYSATPIQRYAYKLDYNGQSYTMDGRPVKKVSSWSKWEYEAGQIFEADVPPETRVLVDLYADSDEPSVGHRLGFIDIEVDDENGFPDINKADKKITAIALYEKTLDEHTVFVLDEVVVVEAKEYDNVSILPYDNEMNLLHSFLDKWQELNFTMVTGWNIDWFDVPYLYRRISRVLGKQYADSLSPIGEVHYNPYRNRFFIAGISCLDYLPLYKKFTHTELPSYNLDMVARHEIKKGKIKYEGSLSKLFQENIEKFIEYNLNDNVLVIGIDEKVKFIELIQGICHKGHVPYEDIYFSSRWIEGAILAYMRNRNIVAPNKNPNAREEMDNTEKFSGAFVKSPESDKYTWLYDLDFTSLYPSLINTLNISPETKVGRIKNWDPYEYVKDNIPQYDCEVLGEQNYLTKSDLNEVMDKLNLSISAKGILYRKDKQGLIPAILDEWFKDKEKYDNLMIDFGKKGDEEKSKYYKDRRTVAKRMLNSVYGVLGLPTFRFYDIDNAESVTTTGVLLIKFAETMANDYYRRQIGGDNVDYCIYIDTDSLFLQAEPLIKHLYPDTDVSDADDMSKKILDVTAKVQDYLNGSFDIFAQRFLHSNTHAFDIKQEVIARTGLWVAKKRYALHIINDAGVKKNKMDFKGLDVVRSNFPLAFRDFMKKFVEDLLKDGKQEDLDARVLKIKADMRTHNFDQIAVPTGIKDIRKYSIPKREQNRTFGNWKKGTPAHVKAGISYNEMLVHLGLQTKFPTIDNGEKIRWAYLKQNPFNLDTLAFKGYDDPPQIMDYIKEYIDYDKIYEKQLKKKLVEFYKAVKWVFPTKSGVIMQKFFAFE